MADLTEVIIILDRSGSMNNIRESTIEGINKLIEEVKREPGEGYWTVAQFDDRDSAKGAGENFPDYILDRVPDSEVQPLRYDAYRPRGGTALVDAVCSTIEQVKKRQDEAFLVKPRTMVVIVTDGEENSSKEFTSARMRELIAEVSAQRDWKFLYLAANVDAFQEARKAGIDQHSWMGKMTGGALAAGSTPYYGFAATNACFSGGVHGTLMSGQTGNVSDAMVSGAVAIRAWKADGNPTAAQLLGNAGPDVETP